jgi:hypothetical protein
VEFADAVRSRRMVRRFRPDPVDPVLIEELLTLAQRAPSAGFSQGFEFLVLHGPQETATFFDVTGSRAWWEKAAPAVLLAPALVIPLADKQAYLDRYAMPDKAGSGLHREDAWPQPYWLTDTAFAAMILQLAAVDRGWAPCSSGSSATSGPSSMPSTCRAGSRRSGSSRSVGPRTPPRPGHPRGAPAAAVRGGALGRLRVGMAGQRSSAAGVRGRQRSCRRGEGPAAQLPARSPATPLR